ncbi:hypothetical protein DCE79_08890 [Lysinibacillus sp. 2017]|uniref:hypothetical protein n=1 Tax=Lysinibacillus sp. 2017 TaxID=2169540 RepID=UPI000D527952|nr:hypothetical protein [Lysinibacillus sp. 2017]AWE07483.1 hypothetical protein DCE79_08890 [Lysinibacillus sp. 2017]
MLTFAQCEEIAIKFLSMYFPAFLPFLQIKVKDASFNEEHRAFFYFGLFVQDSDFLGNSNDLGGTF